ncbi:MAG: type II secretion system GspH family protein [Actinomycetota bacterium]|nr:type II secretion system GspH family protein [Actinomycetota bacterium]
MPEVLTATAILAVLLLIAVIIFLALLERWRVEAAAEQLAADMRLAHSRAINRLTDWRVVLAPKDADDDSGEESGPDYFLVELKGVYEPGYPKPEVAESIARVLPADVKIKDHRSGTSNDAQGETRWVSPIPPGESGEVPDPTRTVEFNSDGTMAFFEGPANSACVTVDGSPMLRVKASFPATSAIEIVDGSGFPCNVD